MNSQRPFRPRHLAALVGSLLAGFAASNLAPAVAAATTEYLSDLPERIISTSQGWGTLGWDAAAHAGAKPGEPLRIGTQSFTKGLGHHAGGRIEVLLDGEYATFEAQVGLQPCGGGGSVVFRVLVDGEPQFDSGVLRPQDPPRSVRVSVAGAHALALEADDAGDGITCDMANWADARLTRIQPVAATAAAAPVDMAQFGRVVTWDPDRTHGTRASRIGEFPAEDLFLETDLEPDATGAYAAPVSATGRACVGLQWLNRRALRELRLVFADAAQVPATDQVRVEGWFGESAWQGEWLPLKGEHRREGDALVFLAAARSPAGGLLLTHKVRWIWPATGDPVRVQRPVALTRSRWATTSVLVQFERPARVPTAFAERAELGRARLIEIFNGELLGNPALTWNEAGVQRLTVRYSQPSPLASDPTQLRLTLPWDRVAVAVEDILEHGPVYLPDFGAYFCRADQPLALADYQRQIAGRRTTLEEVRALPDQTLVQAMARTHNPVQREGPVMVSLAADNTKYIVERDGTVRFRTSPDTTTQWSQGSSSLRLEFEDRPAEQVSRRLDGGWLPIPVINRAHAGVLLSQRVFVAPTDAPGTNPARIGRQGVAVIEFVVSAAAADSPVTPLHLTFNAPSSSTAPYTIASAAYGFVVQQAGEPIAAVKRFGDGQGNAQPSVSGASLRFPREAFLAGADRWVVFLLPPGFPAEDLANLPGPEPLRAAVEAYWKAVLAPAAEIVTPEPFLDDLIRSSQVRCWIAARNEADGARVAPWIAAMSYGPLESEAHSVIRGMDFLGHHGFARRSLDFFVPRYSPEGFLTTGYTTFGTAWHLWALGEHLELTGDRAWLADVAPELKRVGRWIVAQTEKTARRVAGAETESTAQESGRARRVSRASSRGFLAPGYRPESGLMPPGVMADWNAFAYHFCLNAYYAAALRSLGDALSGLGDADAAAFTRAGESLRRNTLSAFAWTRSLSPAVPLRDGTWVAYYPSQLHSPGQLGSFFPGEDAGRSWCYDVELGAHQMVPTGVLDPFDGAVGPMLDHMEDVQFLADGWFDYAARDNAKDWFNRGGFSKVQPFYTRNAEIYGQRDDVRPFIRSYFNALASLVNPEVLTFWEHFRHSGAWDKTHETGYFLHQTRTLLVTERGLELWLAPFVPSAWLADGRTVTVTRAPTRFGTVDLQITSTLASGRIVAEIKPPTARPCLRLVLRLRAPGDRPLSHVTVNGVPHDDFDPQSQLIRLSPNVGRLRVVAEFGAGAR